MDTNIKRNTAILISTSVILYYLLKLKFNKRKENREIPYPANAIKWPIFGHMFALGKSPAKTVARWHQEAGPIYKIHMGNQQWIMISDPFLAHEIFVKAGSATSSRPYHRFNTDIYGKNNKGIVFRQYSQEWKETRKTAASILSPGSIDKFNDLIINEVDNLLMKLEEISLSETPVNPHKLIQLMSANIIFTLCVAHRFQDTEDPDFTLYHDLLLEGVVYSGAAGDLSSFLPLLAWLDLLMGTEKKLKDFINIKRDDLYNKYIKKALEKQEDSLVKSLYGMNQDVDEDNILVLIADLTTAGTDTISNTIHWTLVIFSQLPEVQSKVIQELDAWYSKHDTAPDFHQDRDQFPYLICAQKEVMRFRPVASFGIPHMASKDVEVNGYFLPKGSTLVSSMDPMHRNANFYKNPQEFKPERFTKNTHRMTSAANAKIEERDHFSFGWGRRICPGIHLAELELFHFYVRFFAKFRVEPELDEFGNPTKVDINDYSDDGIVAQPLPGKVRIILR